jgi:hypothetical protein
MRLTERLIRIMTITACVMEGILELIALQRSRMLGER